jgi:hypothetical protein
MLSMPFDSLMIGHVLTDESGRYGRVELEAKSG